MCRGEYDRQRRAEPDHCDTVSLVKTKREPDVIDLLGKIFADNPSLPGAACVIGPNLFDWNATPADHRLAVRLCLEACPALEPCRQRAARGDLTGIVAGEYRPVQPRRQAS